MNAVTGKYLVVVGAILLLLGVGVYFFHDKLQWLGHLPGDIRVERPGMKFYFPITTMVVLSIALSFFMYLVKRFLP